MVEQGRLADRVRELVGDRTAVVALSGGADSALLLKLAVDAGIPTRAVHVHHGQPGSDELERAAGAVAAHLAVPLVVIRVEVPASGSFETAARAARYPALHGELTEGDVLLVGHTADDQAETVLMRLARGSGPSGAAGMRGVQGRIVRPLLEYSGSDVRKQAEDAGLPFVDDPANVDHRHTRVVVRTEILPALERVQPGAGAALARHARLAAELDDAVDSWAAAALQHDRLSMAVYRASDQLLRRRALRLLAQRAGRLAPGEGALQRMHLVADGQVAAAQIDEGYEIVRSGAYVQVIRSCALPPAAASLELGAREWGSWRFDVRSRSGRPAAWPLHSWRAAFPAEGRLTIRALRQADTFGSRRLADSLTGHPSHVRRCWPAVEFDGEVAWVPGVRRLEAGSVELGDDRYRWIFADWRDQWTSERS